MVSKDCHLVLEEIEQLKELLFHSKNKDQICSIVNSIRDLSELYHFITGEKLKNLDKIIPSYFQVIADTDCKRKQVNMNFVYSFLRYRSEHEIFSTKILSFLDETHSIFLDDEDMLQIKLELSETEMLFQREQIQLLRDFMMREGKVKEFDQIIEEKRIQSARFLNQSYGYTLENTALSTYWIAVDDFLPPYEIDYLSTIVHEFGHVVDLKELKNHTGGNEPFYLSKSIYSEVISRRYEKKFLDYLIDHDILLEDSYEGVLTYYNDLHCFLSDTLFFINLIDSPFSPYLEYRSSLLEGGSNSIPIEQKNMKQSLLYSYGGSLAIYFNYLEKENKELFQKYYDRFLQIRGQFFDFSTFSTFMDEVALEEAFSMDLEKTLSLRKRVKKGNN